jgi:mannose-6-phosphate isomerase-like protein (cupin superfamily)
LQKIEREEAMSSRATAGVKTYQNYINGKWVPAKAGQFHTCPRGVAHSSRAADGEELWLICFFTDPLPPEGDRVMIDE